MAWIWGCLMGSSSSTTQETTSTSNQVAIDESFTNSGLAIIDSAITDSSPQVVQAAMQELRATFQVMMSQGAFQLSELLGLGEELLGYADAEQVRLEGYYYQQLETYVTTLREAKEMGKAVITVGEQAIDQSFQFAGQVASDGNSVALRALDLAADVKGGDTAKSFGMLTMSMLIMGLGALYITKGNTK